MIYRMSFVFVVVVLSVVASAVDQHAPTLRQKRKLVTDDTVKKTDPNASATIQRGDPTSDSVTTDDTGKKTDPNASDPINRGDRNTDNVVTDDTGKKINPNAATPGRTHDHTGDDTDKIYSSDSEFLIIRCKEGQGDIGCINDIVTTAAETVTLQSSTGPKTDTIVITQPLASTDFVAIRITDKLIADQVREALLKKGNVVAIEPEPIRNTQMITEGKYAPRQENRRLAGGQRAGYGVAKTNAMNAWAIHGNRIKGEGITVCVVDTGLVDHRDIDTPRIDGSNIDALFAPWNNDGIGHGTHVAGIVAASDNYGGMVGVAPEANIYVARVFDDNGSYRSGGILAAALECKAAGAKVINMSLGGAGSSIAEAEIFENLFTNDGILVIAAAGNDGSPGDTNVPLYPAYYPSVISVGASKEDDTIAAFSTHNDRVDVAAPGVGIYSLDNDGRGYRVASGTSMACPHVAGVAALLFSAKPTATAADVRAAIEQTARDAGTFGKDDFFGHGIVHADNAVELLLAGVTSPTTAPPTPAPVPTSSPTSSPTLDFDTSNGCPSSETAFTLVATTDEFAVKEQTSVTLHNIPQAPVFDYSPMVNDQQISENHCLPTDSCYTLAASDGGFDGTGVSFRVAVQGQVVYDPPKGDFHNRYLTSFGSGCGSCTNFEVNLNSGDWATFDNTRYSLVEKRANDSDVVVFERSNMQDNTPYSDLACLDLSKCYKFKVQDDIGDGVAGGDGAFQLMYDAMVVYEPTSGDFKFIHEVNIGTCV